MASEARSLVRLEDRYTVESGRIYLNGTQALLRLMLDQRRADARNGLNTAGFISGYPGSPLHGVDDLFLAQKPLLDEHHLVFQPGLNEELAATAVWGSQTVQSVPGARYDGVLGMWYGKSLGVERAADALHHANFRGVSPRGGVLVVSGDDPHARSTAYPSETNLTFASFYMPVLAPGNVQEIVDFGLHGYAMSRASGLWVGFRIVNDVVESTGVADVSPGRVNPVVPEVMYRGAPVQASIVMNTVSGPTIENERRIYDGRLEVARQYARLNGLNRIVSNPSGARIGLVAGGKSYYSLREALLNLGIDDAALERLGIRILKMGLLFPVEPSIIVEFAQGLDEIFVIEEKRPSLELHLKDILYALPHRPRIVGKRDDAERELLTAAGELSADQIADAVSKRLSAHGLKPPREPASARSAKVIPLKPLPPRTPYFCSGCPHNRGLRAPEGSVVGAGTGCHGMALFTPTFGEVKGFTQMGGEGTQWIGVAPFTATKHFIQNLGDGTFHHSGSLAVRAAVAAKLNVTYKILYNRAVAMTGGQDVTGAMAIPELVQSLLAEGVQRIIVTTDETDRYPGGKAGAAEVWNRDKSIEAQQLLAATPGVTVLINDQQCAAEKRRLRKRGKLSERPMAAYINPRVCEGCGDCGVKSNCLSVQPVSTEFGRKTQIHQSSCNQDFSCMDGDCPSFLTVRTFDGERPRPGRKSAIEFPSDVALPVPTCVVNDRHFNLVVVGIGGTGVVTVNQVLGVAAFMEGRHVQTYDNTGSSQKAGPVVSHLKIFPDSDAQGPMVSAAAADLYIAADALGGAVPANLSMASADRTVAVVSTSAVPTGYMVSDVANVYPAQEELTRAIEAVTRSDRKVYWDFQQMAERLTGDHLATNLMLVGAAWQLGAIPISAASIEAAIRLNGVAIKRNLDAFNWGRLHVVDPARVLAAMKADESPAATAVPESGARLVEKCIHDLRNEDELKRVLAIRAAELIEFQNESTARQYLQFIQQVRERRPQDLPLQLAVARNLCKLIAYKDEYEVARLHLLAEAEAALQSTFAQKVRVAWNFHPTFLRALGFRKKIQLGSWFRPVLVLLRAMKGIRGTSLDLLGYTRVRRIERALPGFYMAMLTAALSRGSEVKDADLLALAMGPDVIRGYEHVKLNNVTKFLSEIGVLQRKLGIDVEIPAVLVPEMAGAQRATPVEAT